MTYPLNTATDGNLPNRSSLSLASNGLLYGSDVPVEVGGVAVFVRPKKRVIYRDELFTEQETRELETLSGEKIALEIDSPKGDTVGLPVSTAIPLGSIENPIDYWLARYLREKAIRDHQQYLLKLMQDQRNFEEELAVFLLLLED